MKKIVSIVAFFVVSLPILINSHDNQIMKITPERLDYAYNKYSQKAYKDFYAKKVLQGTHLFLMGCVLGSFVGYGYTYMSDKDQERKDTELKKYQDYTIISAIIAGNRRYQNFKQDQKENSLFIDYQESIVKTSDFLFGFGSTVAASLGGTLLAHYLENHIDQIEYEETLEGFVECQTNIYEMFGYSVIYEFGFEDMPKNSVIEQINLLVAGIENTLGFILYQIKNRSQLEASQDMDDVIREEICTINDIIDQINIALEYQSEKHIFYDPFLETSIARLSFVVHSFVEKIQLWIV